MEVVAITGVAVAVAVAVAVRAVFRSRLRRAEEAVKSRDHRLAAVTHELRGPLQPIALAVSRLKREEGLSQKGREAVEIIERNLGASSRMIEDLFDATRGERPLSVRPEPCELNAIVREVVEAARGPASEKGLSIDLHLDPVRPHVLADPVRLRQIIRNLVDNAIKFTPLGGTITVRSDRGEKTSVAIEVTDTGPGVPAASADRIFEPYAQLDGGKASGGLGLGLYIARKLAEAQSGSVSVTSAGPGQGSTFTVLLPRAPGPSAPPTSRPAGTEALPMRILLAEDHEDSARLIGELLSSRGFAVKTVGSLEAGFAEAARSRFDVLISDLELPDGSGLDLMRRLRSAGDVHGIALSGKRTEADTAQSRSAGFSAHLLKPIDFDELLGAIAATRRSTYVR